MLFKPLKDAYNDACQELMNAYPGTAVSHSNFCSLFAKAWKKAVTPENIKLGFQACGIYPFDSSRIPDEAYLPNKLYTNTADVTAVESNAQPEMEANKQVTDKSTDPVSVVALATNDADVSFITSIDTSRLLEMEAMDIFNISISFDEVLPTEPDQPAVDAAVDISGQPRPLIWLCMPLNLPDKLDHYKAAYDKNVHVINDPIYATWKTFKDRCFLQENPAMDNQTDVSFSSLVSGPTNSTPVTSVPVAENVMENTRSHDLTSCHQTSVQGNSTPQSTVQILKPVSVNTTHEADSDSDVLVMVILVVCSVRFSYVISSLLLVRCVKFECGSVTYHILEEQLTVSWNYVKVTGI